MKSLCEIVKDRLDIKERATSSSLCGVVTARNRFAEYGSERDTESESERSQRDC